MLTELVVDEGKYHMSLMHESYYRREGLLGGSFSLKENTPDSDIDIIIHIDDLLENETEAMRVDNEDIMYAGLTEDYPMTWCSLKFHSYKGEIINLIVCLDDETHLMWEMAVKGTILAKEIFKTDFRGDRATRVNMYGKMFQAAYDFMEEENARQGESAVQHDTAEAKQDRIARSEFGILSTAG